MFAIYKKELRTYFTTFIGYVFIAAFLVMSSILFIISTLSQGADSDITSYYTLVILAFVVLIPLLTMKLFSEEKRQKTEVLLLTSPASLFGIVLAKYLAAFTMFAATLAVSCVNLIPLYMYGEQNTGVILGNLFSVLLIGSGFISIGVFISSLTENQLVSAVCTIGAIMLLLAVGMLSTSIGFQPLREVLNFFSIFNRYTYFTYGIVDYSALIYYFSITVIFLFLTVRVFERRRWA